MYRVENFKSNENVVMLDKKGPFEIIEYTKDPTLLRLN